MALQALVDSDQVQSDTVVRLVMVPVFLRKVPLLQDSEKEIDSQVLSTYY